MQSVCSNFSSFLPVTNTKLLRPPLVFWLFRIFIYLVTFLFTSIALNTAQVFSFVFVFFYHLDGIDPNGWITSSPFSLVVFKARSLGLRLISGREKVVQLSFFFILVGSLIALLPIDIILVFLD